MFSILPVFWTYTYPGIVEFSGADRVRCFLAEPSCQAVLKRTSNALTICQFILTGQPVSLHSVISFFHSCRMHQSYQNLRYSLPHPMIIIRIQLFHSPPATSWFLPILDTTTSPLPHHLFLLHISSNLNSTIKTPLCSSTLPSTYQSHFSLPLNLLPIIPTNPVIPRPPPTSQG